MLPYDYWLNGEPGRPNKVGAEGSVGTHTHTLGNTFDPQEAFVGYNTYGAEIGVTQC